MGAAAEHRWCGGIWARGDAGRSEFSFSCDESEVPVKMVGWTLGV